MRRARFSWWCLCVSTVAAFAAPAFAAVEEQALQAQQAAAARLIALVNEAGQAEGEQAARLKRLRTDEFVSLVEAVSDERRLIGSEPVPLAESGRMFEVCNRAQGVMNAMVFFESGKGGQSNEKAEMDYDDPASIALIQRNVIVFQGELSRLQPFLLRCMAWLLPTIDAFVTGVAPEDLTSGQREGVRQLRAGVVMMYAGAIPTLAAESLGDDYKRAMLAAIVESADVYAAASRLVDRKQINDDLRSQRGKVPAAYVAGIDRLIAAFSTTACTGLCVIE
jgi:hypothetical protein